MEEATPFIAPFQDLVETLFLKTQAEVESWISFKIEFETQKATTANEERAARAKKRQKLDQEGSFHSCTEDFNGLYCVGVTQDAALHAADLSDTFNVIFPPNTLTHTFLLLPPLNCTTHLFCFPLLLGFTVHLFIFL